MKKISKLISITILLMVLFSLNTFAMDIIKNELVRSTPQNPKVNYEWAWLNDELCVEFFAIGGQTREQLERMYELGMVRVWGEGNGISGRIRTRDCYAGTWNQDDNGIWSFRFEDCTIPVGLTKIDGVLYAFTGLGELKEGYEYWNGQKTGADGVVTENSPEFLEYLETQYVPECSTKKND